MSKKGYIFVGHKIPHFDDDLVAFKAFNKWQEVKVKKSTHFFETFLLLRALPVLVLDNQEDTLFLSTS